MLIDTNILVYAINSDSSKHKKSKAFLKEFKTDLVIAHQNILEGLRILTHPKYIKVLSQKEALEAVLYITSACKFINPTFQTIYIFLDLIRRYHTRSDQIFDAYLTATALSNGIDTIATDNVTDFKKFKEIKVLNPFV